MCEELGASFRPENFKPNFLSLKDNTIFIIFDICHMVKLIRNNLAKREAFFDSEGGTIEWKYFKEINNIQNEEGLHAGNKITNKHIYFHNEIMRVYLAVQVLSNSVADSMMFFKSSPQYGSRFKNCDATVKFVKIINNLFDIFNSKSNFAFGFKKAISKQNFDTIIDVISRNAMFLLEDFVFMKMV